MERIVVGIDGSDNAARALRWAVGEARLRHAELEVVHAWHQPYAGGYTYEIGTYDPGAFEEAARITLDSAVESVDAGDLAQPVQRTLVGGSAAEVILTAAKDADLVVVGSRGRGGFAGLLLGSVSQQVAHQATCPVVVVPPSD